MYKDKDCQEETCFSPSFDCGFSRSNGGCICKKDFVRVVKNGKCIRKTDCLKTCKFLKNSFINFCI